MRKAILALILLCATAALADAEYRQGSDSVRITVRPCVDPKVLEQISAAGLHPLDFRAAVAQYGGKGYAACWRPYGAAAHLVYEDGDQGIVPMPLLKPVRAI